MNRGNEVRQTLVSHAIRVVSVQGIKMQYHIKKTKACTCLILIVINVMGADYVMIPVPAKGVIILLYIKAWINCLLMIYGSENT